MGERKLPILYTQEVIGIRKTMILSLGLFVASGFLLLFFLISYGKTRKESEEYIHIRQTYTAIREDIFPALAAPVEKQEPKQLPYITADYAGLRELNPDIVGWIAIPDTPISYPVMQAADNQLYLKRDSSGKKSSNGAVFLDANNSLSPLDQNTILYAHNMGQGRETEMFGPLLLYKEKEYLEAHPYIQFDTHLESHGWWEVFAVLHPQGIIVCPCIVGAAIVRSIIAKYGKAIQFIRIDGKIPIHGEIPIYGLPKLQDAVLQIPAGFYFSGVLQHAVGRDRDKGSIAIYIRSQRFIRQPKLFDDGKIYFFKGGRISCIFRLPGCNLGHLAVFRFYDQARFQGPQDIAGDLIYAR